MKAQDHTTIIIADATAHEAFNSINSISKWWTENVEGHSQKLNDEFTVHFGETFMTIRVVETIPGQKIVWLVIDCYKHWIKNNKTEWTGTKICFEITEKENKTQVQFIHVGLIPGLECYDGCSSAWSAYIQQSLFGLISAGKGQPTRKETKAV
jgi:hypothetical protein